MKRLKILTSIITVLFLLFAGNNTTLAQTKVGAGTFYGTEMDGVGLNIYGHHPLGKKTKIGLDLIWWPQSAPDDARYLFTETNLDFQFIPFTIKKFSFYTSLIAGYHYAGVRIKTLGGSYHASDHMGAFGTGAGIEYDLGKFSISTRIRKFFYSGFNQLNIGGGIQIDI